jgi:hypothetical protein
MTPEERAAQRRAEMERGKLAVLKASVDAWLDEWVERMRRRGYRVSACYDLKQNCIAIQARGKGGQVTLREPIDKFPSKKLKTQLILVCK